MNKNYTVIRSKNENPDYPIFDIAMPTQGNSFVSRQYHIYGGSFVKNWERLKKEGYFGVNLTYEKRELPSSLSIPIHDYSLPEDAVLNSFDLSLRAMLQAMIDGEKVFFGCMGGIGRTGLVLGCLSKVFGVDNKDVVYFARENLHPHAMETQEQQDFVRNFDSSNLKFELDKMYLEKLIKDTALEDCYKNTISMALCTKIKHFSAIHPNSMDYLDTLFKFERNEEINHIINENTVSPNSTFYLNGKESNLLSIARQYKNKPIIKDLLLAGATKGNIDSEKFSDKFFIFFLQLSSKIKNIVSKPSNILHKNPNHDFKK